MSAPEPPSTDPPSPPSTLDERARAALCQTLCHAILDPTLAIDDRGRVMMASDSVERVFGWRPQELVGGNVNVLMPEPHHSRHDGYLAHYRETGETGILGRTREFDVLHRDGRTFPCELSVARAELPDGAGPVFVGSFRDVSERRESERARADSERRFRAIFDGSFQYIGLLDPRGTLLEANEASLEGAGVAREEALGMPFWETRWWSVSEESRDKLKDAVRRAAQGEFVRFETVHRGRDDEIVSIDFSLTPVIDDDGNVVLLIPEGRDISELKRAQRSETAMLRALATIGESAAMLAHEIKNPITAVNTALRVVSEQLGEDHRSVITDLVQRMQKLERTMRRTLTFTRPLDVHSGDVEPAELLRQTVGALGPQIEDLGIAIELDTDGATGFVGDRQLLEEALTNLLTNAIEATGSGGRVRLSAARTEAGVRMIVEDDGPGVPEGQLGVLFSPFATSKKEGTGLGLAFCRKVAEAHEGSIEVDASSLGGARFTLSLPSAPK